MTNADGSRTNSGFHSMTGARCSTRTRRSSTRTAGGRTGRVNVEAVSGNYREPAVRAKAAAGFAMHANGPAAAGLLKRLGLGGSDNGSWLRGPADRDPASVEI